MQTISVHLEGVASRVLHVEIETGTLTSPGFIHYTYISKTNTRQDQIVSIYYRITTDYFDLGLFLRGSAVMEDAQAEQAPQLFAQCHACIICTDSLHEDEANEVGDCILSLALL